MLPDIVSRAVVFERIDALIAASAADGRGVGVLAIRVRGLRHIMLGAGYAASERHLAESTGRLASVVRRGDWLARIGDQDFVLLLAGIVDSGQLVLGANKLLRVAQAAGEGSDAPAPIQITIGISASVESGTDAAQLLLAAEQAMARAEQRMVPIEVSSAEVSADRSQDWRIESHLTAAVDRGELELHYQPKVHLADGTVSGLEALSRWNSPDIGPVSPSVFVPIAERGGDIERLTWSSINSVLHQINSWRSAGADLAVAVNLSAVCLRSADVSERVRHALKLWNVRPSALTLEVTESAIMADPHSSFSILRELRSLGVRISIDDFGTGYSSFAYFRNLPADELKIDKSFVANLTSSTADCHLIRSIIDLAHRFELCVVAEGIEDAPTAAILGDMGCEIGQGYYFARPVPADQVIATVLSLSPESANALMRTMKAVPLKDR
ncbi:MAG: putative bifunctional diguanylate cyclase/phosphodiesterase [Steroidobacteraceae bacterium]